MDTPEGWVKFYVCLAEKYNTEPHPRLRMMGDDQCWFLMERDTGNDYQLKLDAIEYLWNVLGEKYKFTTTEVLMEGEEDAGKAERHIYPIEEVLWPNEPSW